MTLATLDAMRADATFARINAGRARRKADDPAEVEHALASAETCAAHVLALAGEVERGVVPPRRGPQAGAPLALVGEDAVAEHRARAAEVEGGEAAPLRLADGVHVDGRHRALAEDLVVAHAEEDHAQALALRLEEDAAEALAESKRVAKEAEAGKSASQRAKARQKPKPKPSVSPPPEGVRGGTSAKPIGRKRDQK